MCTVVTVTESNAHSVEYSQGSCLGAHTLRTTHYAGATPNSITSLSPPQVPRRIIGQQIKFCTRILRLLEREVSQQPGSVEGGGKQSLRRQVNIGCKRTLAAIAGADTLGEAPPAQPEFVDQRTIKKICDVQSKLLPLVEKYRGFQKEDQTAQSVATVLRSVQLGETSTQEATKLLASAAALATAAGSGEMPQASDLFG